MSAFIGITGHFILDWTLKSVMIACKKFKGSHTAEKISQCYEETVECLNISDKICTIVTDNASNMKKAFKIDLPGFETISDVNDDDECDQDDDDDDDISCTDSTSLEHLPRYSGCYAHTLQLVVKDGLKGCK